MKKDVESIVKQVTDKIIKDNMNVAKLTLSSLSMPLDSIIVNSRKIIDITGAK